MIAKCNIENCPLKYTCRRQTTPNEEGQYWLNAEAENYKHGECYWYSPIKQKRKED